MSSHTSAVAVPRKAHTDVAPSRPIKSAFMGRLGSLAESLVFENEGSNMLRGDQVILPDAIALRLQLFSFTFPHATRQSLVALWARWHALRVLAAVVIPALVIDRQIFARLNECSVVFGNGQPHPQAIQVAHRAAAFTTNDPFNRFEVLIWEHLDPFIAALAEHGRTPAKLLWANTAIQFEWFVRQIALEMSEHGQSPQCDARTLLGASLWPDGRPNPLFDAWRPMPTSGDGPRMRRFCCLHYKLQPGNQLCGDCPIGSKKEGTD